MMAWLDVETTGLDPDKDALLEVAMVITDNELDEIEAHQFVLPFKQEDWSGPPIRDVVLKMHEKNGLWIDCRRSADSDRLCLPLTQAEGILLDRLRRFTDYKSGPMCGSTIAFDRAFLKRNMPRFEDWFSHRNLDVSVLTEVSRRWRPDAWESRPSGDGHRALDDTRVSIASMRHYRSALLAARP